MSMVDYFMGLLTTMLEDAVLIALLMWVFIAME